MSFTRDYFRVNIKIKFVILEGLRVFFSLFFITRTPNESIKKHTCFHGPKSKSETLIDKSNLMVWLLSSISQLILYHGTGPVLNLCAERHRGLAGGGGGSGDSMTWKSNCQQKRCQWQDQLEIASGWRLRSLPVYKASPNGIKQSAAALSEPTGIWIWTFKQINK